MKRAEPVRESFRTADLGASEQARPRPRRRRNGRVTTVENIALKVAFELTAGRDVRVVLVSATEAHVVNRR